jgi:aminoglycoside phosphotransferase (APT) family kinase protein
MSEPDILTGDTLTGDTLTADARGADGLTIPAGLAPREEAVVLSPEWLSPILAARYPGVAVTATEVTERLETVATKIRFRVTYAADTARAPANLCVKGYFNPAGHGRSTRTEVDFYRLLAPRLPVRTPPCIHAAADEDTGHALILMRDLKADGATFLDPQIGYAPEEAAKTLAELASLHVATWGARAERPELTAACPPRLAGLARVLPAETLQSQLDDGRAPDVAAPQRRADRLLAAMDAMAALTDGPRCLVHGDLHTGNVYRLADGSPGLIDWQVVQRGSWALDIAYHLAAVLDPDELARSERGLLDHYLGQLAARGITPPRQEDAWWAYRAHLPYGYYLWAITRAVDRPIVEHLTGRLSVAAARHASLDLLGV